MSLLVEIEERVRLWAQLGHNKGCNHEFALDQQTCIHCNLRFDSIDNILNADCSDLEALLCTSPRQQRDAMDDSFLEDLDQNPRNRRLKRQWECLVNIQPRLTDPQSRRPENVVKFKTNAVLPLGRLFAKKRNPAHTASTPVTPDDRLATPFLGEDFSLINVNFEHDESTQTHLRYPLARTVLILDTQARMADLLEIIAKKLNVSLRQLVEDFSARDESGGFLGMDDLVRESLLLRARSLSL